MCIRRDVLQMTDQDPLFDFDRNADGTLKPFGAEDMTFCRKMYRNCVSVWVDQDVVGEHVTDIEMLRTMEEQCASSDSNDRRASVLEIDARKLPIDLPAGANYRCSGGNELGPFELPGGDASRVFAGR